MAPSRSRRGRPVVRDLDWDGCFNVRDLGGLPAGEGRTVRHGALVRADSLQKLTQRGWRQLRAHGVRTVIDLRNDDERGEDAAPRPASVRTVRVALDALDERDFWDDWQDGPQFATPLYYGPHLRRFADRSADVIASIARAEPGGVAFHCVGGRDRSGQIAMLALSLLGVSAEEIAADYALSDSRLAPMYEAAGEEDPAPELKAFLRERGTTAAQVLAETLRSIDIERTLSGGGLEQADLVALRKRALA